MRDIRMSVQAAEYHTAGEPFRIVTGGVGPIPGETILDKRRYARQSLDEVRALLVNEPRGHADMYGCFVTDPVDAEGHLGVLFFHNAGFSTACGHGTIALATWAIDSGLIEAKEPETHIVIDAPSGRLATVARVQDGHVESVKFQNVPSFVHSEGVEVKVDSRMISADISYGGAFYASVRAADVGLSVDGKHLPALIDVGRKIKASIESSIEVVHPEEPELRDIYGVIFYEDIDAEDAALGQRNVTIFADGEVDRSPCGSGTSARLALLDAQGTLGRGDELLHESIIRSRFRARVSGETSVGDLPALITEVEGTAHLVGWHTFVLKRTDELGTGFLLR